MNDAGLPGAGQESASAKALVLLDELGISLLESVLVLESLRAEVDLNFDELTRGIQRLQLLAEEAFGAATLLHQGAELAEAWGAPPSRPRAIFARHAAAVRAGAVAFSRRDSTSAVSERKIRQLPNVDRAAGAASSRPTCQAIIRKTGQPCESAAIYLGSGSFAQHCYSHSSRAEREGYHRYQEIAKAELEGARRQQQATIQTFRAKVAAGWMRRRVERREVARGQLSGTHTVADAPGTSTGPPAP